MNKIRIMTLPFHDSHQCVIFCLCHENIEHEHDFKHSFFRKHDFILNSMRNFTLIDVTENFKPNKVVILTTRLKIEN
jgi:hypothetical protein